MFKKIFTILIAIIATLLFLMIYWRGSNPISYYSFWSDYPKLKKIFVCDTCGFDNKTLFATSSENIKSKQGQIIVNREIINVEIANSENDRISGLSNRQFLDKKTGMLFVFDKTDYHSFWMKDMLIYLDIVFLDENWKILAIEENLSPDSFPKTFNGGVKSKYVLEINAGEADLFKFRVGEKVIFLNR